MTYGTPSAPESRPLPVKILPKYHVCQKCGKKCLNRKEFRKHENLVHKCPCPVAGCSKRFWRREKEKSTLQSDMGKHFAACHPKKDPPYYFFGYMVHLGVVILTLWYFVGFFEQEPILKNIKK